MRTSILRHSETGRIVVPRLLIPGGWLECGVGLLGHKELPPGSGMWIEPCSSVHTFGMRFAIDVVFLDKLGVVVRTVHNLRPCRIAGPVRGARTALELPAGAASQLGITQGQQYRFEQGTG